jgi:hypothetical protein
MTLQDEARRKTSKLTKIVMLVVIFLPLFVFLFGEAVLHLWNWLIPMLFRLPTITFWQAWGILALSWLLFGGLRGSGPRSGYRASWRRRMQERMQEHWERMTPEEREKFREWIQSRCTQA